jgi:hypothetical protein
MGATLGKSKAWLISEKVNGQEKQVPMISSKHTNKTTTLDRKTKKKEKLSNKKSSDTMIDKYTSTDGGVVSSSAYIKHLVSGSGRQLSLDSLNPQGNSRRQSETPSKDVLEFRDACIRRGIISPETINATVPSSIEQDYQVNTENTVEESTNEILTTNDEQVQNEQQQQVES